MIERDRFITKFHKTHLILLNEWKAQSSIDETVRIINERLGENFITSKGVQKWFDRFDNGDISNFPKNSNVNISIQGNNPFNSLLFMPDEKQNLLNLIKCNDRFIEYKYCFKRQWFIVHYDLFLNEKKVIKLPLGTWKFQMLGDGFLLVFGSSYKLHLIEVDYENSTYSLLDSIGSDGEVDFILMDQLDPLKFILIYKNSETISLGEILNEKIVLSDVRKSVNYIGSYAKRLMGPILQSVNYCFDEKTFLFCELNLDTMERKVSKTGFDSENDPFGIADYESDVFYWSENRFYSMFEMNDNKQYHVLMLDLDVMKWKDIQIVVPLYTSMFVDSNDILSLNVGNCFIAFYRIALRKPDSLKNLTHLSILRQSTLFGKDKYLNCVKRLFD